MTLDPRFIVTSDLDSYYVDKDTGAPLAGGIVTFYSDVNRTQLKPIYQLTGDATSGYSYVALPNPIILNGDGTFSDNAGNNIVPYYFPFEGVPSDNNNNVELYYITVFSSTNIEQFTRQAWPNFSSQDVVGVNVSNYIPNGQFLLHNNNGAQSIDNTTETNTYRYQIAQGGWFFKVPSSTGSVNDILFEEFGSYIENPTSTPEFVCRVKCISPDPTDSIKDLAVQFNDVNKFSSPSTALQDYTFYFEAQSNTGSPVNVGVYVVKNYGEGGDAQEEFFKSTIAILPGGYNKYSTVFNFGDNVGKNLGPGGFVQIILRFPLSSASDTSLTNFVLAFDSVAIESFPITTDQEFVSNSLGWLMPTPDPDGFDLYLPLVYTQYGMKFDDSQIGDVIAKTVADDFSTTISSTTNELIADGTQFITSDYSALGIPFARLQRKYFNNDPTKLIPRWGTGESQGEAYWYQLTSNPSTNLMFLKTNTRGPSPTNINAGTSGFTVATIKLGANYNCNCFLTAVNNTCFIISDDPPGTITSGINAGTSTFTVLTYRNTPNTRNIYYFTTVAAAGLNNLQFYFYIGTQAYYVWYNVDGAGVDPGAPVMGALPIQVNLKSGDTADYVAALTMSAISGFEIWSIQCIAASAMTAGSYFTYSTPFVNFYVWYKINGAGTDPLASDVGIEVDLLSTDDAHTVTQKTIQAINSYAFAIPDFRGYFLRGIDNDNNNTDNVNRDHHAIYSILASQQGYSLNTFQTDIVLQHLHPIVNLPGVQNGTGDVHLPIIGPAAVSNPDKVFDNAALTQTNQPNLVNFYPDDYTVAPNASPYVDNVQTLSNGNTGYQDPQTYGFDNRPLNATVLFVIKY